MKIKKEFAIALKHSDGFEYNILVVFALSLSLFLAKLLSGYVFSYENSWAAKCYAFLARKKTAYTVLFSGGEKQLRPESKNTR